MKKGDGEQCLRHGVRISGEARSVTDSQLAGTSAHGKACAVCRQEACEVVYEHWADVTQQGHNPHKNNPEGKGGSRLPALQRREEAQMTAPL